MALQTDRERMFYIHAPQKKKRLYPPLVIQPILPNLTEMIVNIERVERKDGNIWNEVLKDGVQQTESWNGWFMSSLRKKWEKGLVCSLLLLRILSLKIKG